MLYKVTNQSYSYKCNNNYHTSGIKCKSAGVLKRYCQIRKNYVNDFSLDSILCVPNLYLIV